MIVYAIRHGECLSNANGVFSPTEGNPLTEKGLEDARSIGKILDGIKFDRIYASTYIRAQQTAKTAIPGSEPILDWRIRECDYGSLALKGHRECLDTMGDEFRKDFENRDFSPYGGESTHDQIVRVKSFMEDLQKLDSSCVIAVFCHAGTIMSMLSVALGVEFNFRKTYLANGSVSVFEFKKEKWILKKWGITENDL